MTRTAMTHHLKTGDLTPPIEAVLTDGNGDPVDLSDIGEIRFHMSPAQGGAATVNAEAEVVDGEAGLVRYDWQEGDTDDDGIFRAEFEVTSAGLPTTFPNDGYITVVIRKGLDDEPGS